MSNLCSTKLYLLDKLALFKMNKNTKFNTTQHNPCMCKGHSKSLVFLNDYIDHSRYPLKSRLKQGIKNGMMSLLSPINLRWDKYLGERVTYHRKVYESELIFKNKKIVRCDECNLTWLHPMPSNHDLASYYGSSFWDNKQTTFQLSAGSSKEKNRAFYQYEFMKPFIDFSHQIEDMLEIGAGHAGISYFIHNLFSNITTSILEPDESFRNTHKNIGVCTDTFKDLNEIDKRYDLVLSSHSLEHVSNILEDISIIAKVLKPKGYFFLEVPNANDIYFKCYRTDIPHTYFFNLESIQGLAEHFNLKILDIGEFGPNKEEFMAKNYFTIEEKNMRKANGGNLRCLLQKQS